MSHYDSTKNRFNPQNRFVGDIEDGKRYPFGCYSKEEADERFALKETVTALQTAIAAINTQIADILQRLEALEYNDIKINTFSASPTTIERGSQSTINLAWSVNKTGYTATINGEPVTGTSTTKTITSATQFTLSVTDGHSTDSKTVGVLAANRIYYGADTDLTDVTSLQSIVSDNKNRTITVTAGAGEYIIYAYPKRLGLSEFWVEQFEGGFDPPVETDLTNTHGYTETYYIYKSEQPNLGETTIEIKEAT